MDKNKYNRAAKDSSQLQHFVDETCESTLDPEQVAELTDLLKKVSIDEDGWIVIESLNPTYLYIPGLSQIMNEGEESLFPLYGNAGKVLAVNNDEDGLEAISISGGTKLYAHTFELGGSPLNRLIIISTESNPYLSETTSLQMLYMNIFSSASVWSKIVNIFYEATSTRYLASVSSSAITYLSSTISTYGSSDTVVGIDAVTSL